MMQCYWLRIYTNNAGPETVYSVTDRLGIVIVSEHVSLVCLSYLLISSSFLSLVVNFAIIFDMHCENIVLPIRDMVVQLKRVVEKTTLFLNYAAFSCNPKEYLTSPFTHL